MAFRAGSAVVDIFANEDSVYSFLGRSLANERWHCMEKTRGVVVAAFAMRSGTIYR